MVGGIDVDTSAQKGLFFGPTNKENAVGAKQSNFLTSDKQIIRPKFRPKERRKGKPARTSLHHLGKMATHLIIAEVFFPTSLVLDQQGLF